MLPSCVPLFTMNRVKAAQSRKKRAKFWHIKGKCAFGKCGIKYQCYVRKEPIVSKHIKLKIKISGNFKHDKSCTKATKCDGSERKALGREACEKGPTELYHEKLGTISQEQYVAGNMSACKTPSVLKKAAFECREQERLHNDVIAELLI